MVVSFLKRTLKRGTPLTIALIYAAIFLFILLLFSDFLVKNVITNSKAILIIQKYRFTLYYILSVLGIFHIVRVQIKQLLRSDEALKKSEDSYQILVENLREDYFFYRHQRGEVFQNVSPSIRNILGYTPAEFRENFIQYKADRLVGDYLKRHRDLFESGIKHPPFEIEVIHKDKSKRILEVKEIPIVGDNNEIIAVEGIARDITEYKRVEGELRDKDTKFHILFESANDAILILKGEKIIDCNRKALDMFSCSVDQIIMQVPYSYKLSPPNQIDGRSSKEKGRERLITALNGVPQFFEWKFIRLNGELFDAEMNLSHFSFNGEDFIQAIIRDITDRKKAQVALQESEAYYKDLYENSMVGLFRTQIEDGTLIDGNQATAVIFGFTNISEAISENFKVSSLYSSERRKELLRLLKEKGSVQDFEVLLRLSNGHEKSVSLSARMYEEKGILEGTIIDISKRKVAETKLAHNEERFREILDYSRAILYKLDIKSGYYEYISPAITEILGYTPQDIYNMDVDRFKALLHPEDLGKADNIIAKLIASVPGNRLSYTTEYRIRHKRGYYRWLSDSYVIINTDNGNPDYIIGNVFDITERKEAQEALKESELRFRKMADNIQNGVTINENGKNVYVNDRLMEITGYSQKELLSFSEFQIAAPEEKKRLQQIGLELERTGQKLEELEFWIVRKDGQRRCIMNRYSYNYVNNNVLVKYIISIDITERKLMENALRESEEKFRELANMLPQTIFECDLEGKLTYTNSRGLKQFGFIQKEFDQGLYIHDRILPEQTDLLKSNFKHLIEGEKFEQSEYTAIRKDGSVFPMLVYPNLIYKGDKVIGIRGVVIDTSNQKRIQEELKIAKEAAEAASKAKSIFLTNISHELRTPMNSIFGMTELIKKTQLSGKQYDFLKVITESSENLLSILNDIITIPKLESGDIKLDRKAFRMQDIMTSAVGIVTYQAELKKVKLIETQNFPDELIVISDPSRLNQILINILDNSIRYTEKGSIEIRIDMINETTDKILIGFTITDTSSKYPKKLIDALNDDFDKAHIEVYNEFGSTGLGLLIACQLIRISGSGLSIERFNNNSSRYYFEIEYRKGVPEDLDRIHDFTDSEKQEFLQNVRILLAEDEIFNQLVVLSMIEDWDCEVDVVENGQQAVEMIAANDYEILLLDIFMPEMDGHEVTRIIRTEMEGKKKNIPIVAITNGTDITDINDYLAKGINYVITKPFRSNELFHVLVKSTGIKQTVPDLVVEEPLPLMGKGKKQEYNLSLIENIAKNNKVLIIKMIRVFIDKSTEELKLLKKAAKEKDMKVVGLVAHKMKPAAAYMGISAVESKINEMNQLAKEGNNTKKIIIMVDEIEKSLKEVFSELEKEINKYK